MAPTEDVGTVARPSARVAPERPRALGAVVGEGDATAMAPATPSATGAFGHGKGGAPAAVPTTVARAPAPDAGTREATSEATSPRWRPGALLFTLAVGLAIGAVLTRLSGLSGLGGLEAGLPGVFLVSMAIGIAGAFVFLIVQMLTEAEGNVLTRITRPRYGVSAPLMAVLFLLSGGLVAGFSQASAGSFGAGNIWTTFLIGFGWQGVIAGVGGAAAVREQEKEGDRVAEAAAKATADEFKPLVGNLRERVTELEAQLKAAGERAAREGPAEREATQGGPPARRGVGRVLGPEGGSA